MFCGHLKAFIVSYQISARITNSNNSDPFIFVAHLQEHLILAGHKPGVDMLSQFFGLLIVAVEQGLSNKVRISSLLIISIFSRFVQIALCLLEGLHFQVNAFLGGKFYLKESRFNLAKFTLDSDLT